MNALVPIRRAGDPGSDWDLLQRLSFSSPEAFWPHLLHLLSIRFHHPPHRCHCLSSALASAQMC